MRFCLLQNPFSSSPLHIYVLYVKVDISLSLGIMQLNEPPGSLGILKANVTYPDKFRWQTVKLCDNMKEISGRVGETFLVNLLKRKFVNHSLLFQTEGWPPLYLCPILPMCSPESQHFLLQGQSKMVWRLTGLIVLEGYWPHHRGIPGRFYHL